MYCSKLRPLNSNLRACIAHHKGLYSTLGPSSTTQRPLTSIRRFCTAPRVALENTIGPSRATQTPMNSTLEACPAPLVAAAGNTIAIGPHSPYYHRETIERYPESQQVPSPSNGDPYRTPYYHSETIEEHHESLYSPSCGTGDNTGPLVSVRNN